MPHLNSKYLEMDIKNELVAKCREIIIDKIGNLKAEVEDAQKTANDYGQPKDRYDAFRAQLLRKRDMFSQQLVKNNEQLELLNRIDFDKKLSTVKIGALVVTENQKLLISISLGKIEVDGEAYYAISPAVPFYKVIDGKKVGDSFEFNGRKNKILEVY